jgi:3-oxo-5alpha-steroid 4-dehydrogenase
VDESAAVVVVGFGAAGACAAIEAAESGATVLVVDRFAGGGATAISGGVVYGGGGTRQQRRAGITDTPEAMYGYLRHEVGDAVSAATLRRFCDESAGLLAWLEERGVPFDAGLCPYKTSYPTNRHYLYQSGSEHLYPSPAPRGHRVRAPGTSGGTLHARLAGAARDRGVRFLPQTRAVALSFAAPGSGLSGSADSAVPAAPPDPARPAVNADARVLGVVCRTLREAPAWARLAHDRLHRLSVKPGVYLPGLGRLLHRAATRIEDRHGRDLNIRAGAVVLAAGGFVFGREMMRRHAPGYRGLRLGTPGDDGSGIRLGTGAGAGTAHLDRLTLWRFLTPPSALLGGLLVDRTGRRICDESRYGAAIGDAVFRSPEGRAWLLVDATVLSAARRQLWRQTLWFQRLQAWWLLTAGRISAPTVAELARRTGIDPDGLAATVAAANTACRDGAPDPAGKPRELTCLLVRPPFSLLDVSLRSLPAPMLTLGGLTVDEVTGQVLRPDAGGIPGLYAAGRTAVGICSSSYVSGLSLADCVFSGRRAGDHAARAAGGDAAGSAGRDAARSAGRDAARVAGGDADRSAGRDAARVAGGDAARSIGRDAARAAGGDAARSIGRQAARTADRGGRPVVSPAVDRTEPGDVHADRD